MLCFLWVGVVVDLIVDSLLEFLWILCICLLCVTLICAWVLFGLMFGCLVVVCSCYWLLGFIGYSLLFSLGIWTVS